MMGFLEIAAAAAFLAIRLLPFSEARRNAAVTSKTSLSNLPVVLAQMKEGREVLEVDCEALQLEGPLKSSEFVKLTGAGWSAGPLTFLVSKQGGNQLDQLGDAAIGSSVVSLTIHPPAQNGDKSDPEEGQMILTEYLSSSTKENIKKSVSLPIESPDNGFMFICTTKEDGAKLLCKVSGFDNKEEESSSGWQTTDLEFPLQGGANDLRFSVLGDQVVSPKIYATSGLKISTTGAALGCHEEGAPIRETALDGIYNEKQPHELQQGQSSFVSSVAHEA